jgi:hypothetical protein
MKCAHLDEGFRRTGARACNSFRERRRVQDGFSRLFSPGPERFIHLGKSASRIRFQHIFVKREEDAGKVFVLDKEGCVFAEWPDLKDMFAIKQSPEEEIANPSQFPVRNQLHEDRPDFHAGIS